MKEYWKCEWRDKYTTTGSGFTVGRTYERNKGILYDDEGFPWSSDPKTFKNVRMERVLEFEDRIGDKYLLTIKSEDNKTRITYKTDDRTVEKEIDKEITESELLGIVAQLEGEPSYLTMDKKHYGIIGTKTDLTDSLGKQLFVGDVVKIYYQGEENGEEFVVFDGEKFFVMGIAGQTKDIDFGFRTKKIKHYEEVENNEQYGVIKAV